MRRLTSKDLKELNLLKHYRIIRKWACKTSGLNDADLELLIYLDAIEHFTKKVFDSAKKLVNSDYKKFSVGFSDDDLGNVRAVEEFVENELNKM